MRIDLHIHTDASDGEHSPAELVRAARAGRLDIIAVTDHDTVAGIPEALREREVIRTTGEATGARRPNDVAPFIIPGIEVSCIGAGTELHLLGYFIDPDDPQLQRYTADAARRRRERIRKMIELLADLGIEVEYDDVVRAAGGEAPTLGRPHLARALVTKGYVPTVSDAFDRYLGDDRPAFLPTDLISPRDAIELIEGAGGIAVWAHPPWELLETMIDDLVEWGLQGIECHRPRNTRSMTNRLLDTAEAYELLVTGGSDWHGEWNGPLGAFSISDREVGEFLREGGL